MNKFVLTAEESNTLFNLGVPMGEATVFDEDNDEILFTLQDLFALLPKKIKGGSTTFRLRMGVDVSDNYWVKYVSEPWGVDSLESYQESEELCDAVFNMIVWLKTKKIKEL